MFCFGLGDSGVNFKCKFQIKTQRKAWMDPNIQVPQKCFISHQKLIQIMLVRRSHELAGSWRSGWCLDIMVLLVKNSPEIALAGEHLGLSLEKWFLYLKLKKKKKRKNCFLPSDREKISTVVFRMNLKAMWFHLRGFLCVIAYKRVSFTSFVYFLSRELIQMCLLYL